MPRTEMIDRVAKAMLVNDGYELDRLDHYADPASLRAEYWSNARAAIAAMREPTPGMIKAMSDNFWTLRQLGFAFTAAIDAALAEKEQK